MLKKISLAVLIKVFVLSNFLLYGQETAKVSVKDLFSHQKHAGLLLLLSFLVPQLVCAQYSEYEVKAVYLEKLTRFIEWPADSSISDTTRPFVVGVLGENPFDHILEKFYKTIKIKNKKVVVKYISDKEQIYDINLLYISSSEKNRLLTILSQTNKKPILTISDSNGFADEGVHINLYRKNKRIDYEINETSLVKSGFSAWAQLLSSAKIVNPLEKK